MSHFLYHIIKKPEFIKVLLEKLYSESVSNEPFESTPNLII